MNTAKSPPFFQKQSGYWFFKKKDGYEAVKKVSKIIGRAADDDTALQQLRKFFEGKYQKSFRNEVSKYDVTNGNNVTNDGRTYPNSLFHCIEKGFVRTAEYLIEEQEADVNFTSSRQYGAMSSVFYTVRRSSNGPYVSHLHKRLWEKSENTFEMMKVLLDHGATICEESSPGASPFVLSGAKKPLRQHGPKQHCVLYQTEAICRLLLSTYAYKCKGSAEEPCKTKDECLKYELEMRKKMHKEYMQNEEWAAEFLRQQARQKREYARSQGRVSELNELQKLPINLKNLIDLIARQGPKGNSVESKLANLREFLHSVEGNRRSINEALKNHVVFSKFKRNLNLLCHPDKFQQNYPEISPEDQSSMEKLQKDINGALDIVQKQ
eukprot:g2163.t1